MLAASYQYDGCASGVVPICIKISVAGARTVRCDDTTLCAAGRCWLIVRNTCGVVLENRSTGLVVILGKGYTRVLAKHVVNPTLCRQATFKRCGHHFGLYSVAMAVKDDVYQTLLDSTVKKMPVTVTGILSYTQRVIVAKGCYLLTL